MLLLCNAFVFSTLYLQRSTVKVGDIGVIPIQKHLTKKGHVKNLPVKVTSVHEKGVLHLDLLDKDFQEIDVAISTKVPAKVFRKGIP